MHEQLVPNSADRHWCSVLNFLQSVKTIIEVSFTVAVFGRPLGGLSSTVRVSRRLDVRQARVLCEITGLRPSSKHPNKKSSCKGKRHSEEKVTGEKVKKVITAGESVMKFRRL